MNRQSRFDAGYGMLGLVYWDDPEGWYMEGRGRGVQDGKDVPCHWGGQTVHISLESKYRRSQG